MFTSYKDTARYLFAALAEKDKAWVKSIGAPQIRRIDSGNHPDERMGIVAAFAPEAMGGLPKGIDPIDILISTDVLSEGQNLQDCAVCINYDLTWNPIRLVQRSGRIDRLLSKHEYIHIWNIFPEKELEGLLHLIERLNARITQIDELGMLDASVLGEVVHPRTFNTIRRIQGGDVTVLDEEEARAELAGPELLLKQLKEMLGREGSRDIVNLPDGIHSGLRRQKDYGMFFYFKTPRPGGEGFRHFWRYIDAKTYAISDNRFQIAQLIGCRPDEPRFIGDQDVFDLQERVIQGILKEDQTAAAKAIIASTPEQVQLGLAEDLKGAMRRGTVDRATARQAIQFLDQPAGKALLARLRDVRSAFADHKDDQRLADDLLALADEYRKPSGNEAWSAKITRDNLHLICFEYLSM
ncbi:MAG: helicase-related protein [Tepidisphaeraceae bacterium]